MFRHVFRKRLPVVAALLAAVAAEATAADALRVCASSNEMPYSNSAGEGFENRLARRLGELLKRPVEFAFSEKVGIYHVHEMLNPGRCDLILGVDPGDSRVRPTQPYYRSSYVVVQRADSPPLNGWDDPAWSALGKIAFAAGSPAETMLRKLGLYDENLSYMYSLIGFKPRRNQYVRFEPARMVGEVASGRADAAIVWGPEAARYVRDSTVPLRMTPVADAEYNGVPVPFQYDQAMAVRGEDSALAAELDAVIAASGDTLRAVLEEEGMPVAPPGSPLAAKLDASTAHP